MNFEQKKLALLSHLKQLRSLSEETGSPTVLPKIDAEIQKLAEERFHLVVVGQFKRGKTTFINAILGEPLLPTAVVPLTSVLTLIRYGETKRMEVIFKDNKRNDIAASALEEFVTERGNPSNKKNVQHVEIYYPAEFLKEGIVLIDTPGVGSLFQHNTQTTVEFIPNIDAAIFVLSPDPPLTQTEYEFLNDVTKHVHRIFFVLNKVDTLDDSELNQIIEYTTRALREKFPQNHLDIYPLSARRALEGSVSRHSEMLRQSNLLAIEEMVQSFVENEKWTILLNASINRFAKFISEVCFILDLELASVQTPLAKLEKKIHEVQRCIEQTKKDRELFEYVLNGEVSTLQKWIENELARFQEIATKKLQTLLSAWAHQVTEIDNKEFLKNIEQKASEYLVIEFEEWRTRCEPEICKRYERIIKDFSKKTNEIIATVMRRSAELFNVRTAPLPDLGQLQWQQTFYYQLDKEPLFLEVDALKAFVRLLPSSYLKKKYLKRILDELEKNIMRHCGKLGYEYNYSIQESSRTFFFEMKEKMNEVIQEINIILEKALQRQQQGSANVRQEVERIQQRLRKLSDIEQSFKKTQ